MAKVAVLCWLHVHLTWIAASVGSTKASRLGQHASAGSMKRGWGSTKGAGARELGIQILPLYSTTPSRVVGWTNSAGVWSSSPASLGKERVSRGSHRGSLILCQTMRDMVAVDVHEGCWCSMVCLVDGWYLSIL